MTDLTTDFTPDIAIVGAGIAGLGAAWALARSGARITVYEADCRIGGHANTIEAPAPGGGVQPIDTGFLVFNHRTYPNLTRLFDHLGVATHQSCMSLGVSIDEGRIEYGCSRLGEILAQPANLLRPRFWAMVGDLLRFYREAPAAAARDGSMSLREYLALHGFGDAFVRDHLLPMAGAIWSATDDDVLAYPLGSFVSFCVNHGLLELFDRPTWYTVSGGSRAYVQRLTAPFADRLRIGQAVVAVERGVGLAGLGVRLRLADGSSVNHGQVVMATHADRTLALLAQPSAAERAVLGAFRYTVNDTWAHTDVALMPRRRRVWSSWNVLARSDRSPGQPVTVSYWINRLQAIANGQDYFVTLNPQQPPRADTVLGRFTYAHPQYDRAAVAAQARIADLQGAGGVWVCGSWCGWGFHEDALASGLAVARALGASLPWTCQEVSPAAAHTLGTGHSMNRDPALAAALAA